MDIATSINQQAHKCVLMCQRDLDLAEAEPERAEKLLARVAERLPFAFPNAELALRVASHPDPGPFQAMLAAEKWHHPIKNGLLGGDPRLAQMPVERLQALEDADAPLSRIFNMLMSRAEEEDDPEIFRIALGTVAFENLTPYSLAGRWIENCTPARAPVMADFLKTMGAYAPRALEATFKFQARGDQQFLSAKLVLIAEVFYDRATDHLVHVGEGTGGLGMAVIRALRSNHGKMNLLGRWPSLEDRLGLTAAEIEEACPPG